ncbi:hypothetical protein MMC20_004279 [Loxospora ochrophaea]|nr:hypothetical protein [Loxospora ochrophaea]
MFYDLNIPWTPNGTELHRTLEFLAELGYTTIALNYTLPAKLSATLTCAIPDELSFPVPCSLRILRRCTMVLSDTNQNHRLPALSSAYDLVALRPVTEKSLQQACQSLDTDLISLDLSTRLPFHFRHKTLSVGLQRGLKFEICYASAILSGGDGGMARRNLISNATQLIRATRGKGIVISSEAKRALGCRSPWDAVNLGVLWGLGQEKGREAVEREARAVVVGAEMKRRSFRGIVDVLYGGEKPEADGSKGEDPSSANGKLKRKAVLLENTTQEQGEQDKPMSKRGQKRQARKVRLGLSTSSDVPAGQSFVPPIQILKQATSLNVKDHVEAG